MYFRRDLKAKIRAEKEEKIRRENSRFLAVLRRCLYSDDTYIIYMLESAGIAMEYGSKRVYRKMFSLYREPDIIALGSAVEHAFCHAYHA